MEPDYFIAILWLFWVAIILKKIANYRGIILFSYLLLIVSLFSIIFWGSYIDKYLGTNIFDLTWKVFTKIDVLLGRSSRFEEFGLLNPDQHIIPVWEWSDAYINKTKIIFENHFGLGFVFGIVGPFLKETLRRPEFIPFFIEGIIIIMTPIILFLYIIVKKLFNYNNINCLNYIYGVIPAIILVMIVHALFGILNPGTAIRWRVNFELLFYFAPMLLYFNILESKNEKNNSLSS